MIKEEKLNLLDIENHIKSIKNKKNESINPQIIALLMTYIKEIYNKIKKLNNDIYFKKFNQLITEEIQSDIDNNEYNRINGKRFKLIDNMTFEDIVKTFYLERINNFNEYIFFEERKKQKENKIKPIINDDIITKTYLKHQLKSFEKSMEIKRNKNCLFLLESTKQELIKQYKETNKYNKEIIESYYNKIKDMYIKTNNQSFFKDFFFKSKS